MTSFWGFLLLISFRGLPDVCKKKLRKNRRISEFLSYSPPFEFSAYRRPSEYLQLILQFWFFCWRLIEISTYWRLFEISAYWRLSVDLPTSFWKTLEKSIPLSEVVRYFCLRMFFRDFASQLSSGELPTSFQKYCKRNRGLLEIFRYRRNCWMILFRVCVRIINQGNIIHNILKFYLVQTLLSIMKIVPGPVSRPGWGKINVWF